MKLTRVEAATMQEALWKIRASLGNDAMIVGTRTLRRGGVFGVGGRDVVEVYVAETGNAAAAPTTATAPMSPGPLPATEPAAPTGRPAPDSEGLAAAFAVLRAKRHGVAVGNGGAGVARPAGRARRRAPDVGADRDSKSRREVFEHPFLDHAFELLRAQDVDVEIARRLVLELNDTHLPVGAVDPDRVRSVIKAQLRKLFHPNVPTALFRKGTPVQVLVGATGVGKTTTVAKLAARAKINERKRVGLVTLDTFRIAAVDQLQKYARIIGIPLEVVSDPVEFRGAVERLARDDLDLILVDTAGRGQRDELKMRELAEFLSVLPNAEIHLVLSTTTQPRTFRRVAERFVPLGVDRLVLTKLDETESFGSLLKAIVEIGKPVSFVTDGQNVPDDIMVSDPDRLTDLVFRRSQF